MTAKSKAEELVNKFKLNTGANTKINIYVAKQCALIAVDEIIKQEAERCLAYKETDKFVDYWQEVKQEIEKL